MSFVIPKLSGRIKQSYFEWHPEWNATFHAPAVLTSVSWNLYFSAFPLKAQSARNLNIQSQAAKTKHGSPVIVQAHKMRNACRSLFFFSFRESPENCIHNQKVEKMRSPTPHSQLVTALKKTYFLSHFFSYQTFRLFAHFCLIYWFHWMCIYIYIKAFHWNTFIPPSCVQNVMVWKLAYIICVE